MNNIQEWLEVEKHLFNQTKNKDIIQAMNFLLELGCGEKNMAYSTELTIIDKYDAMVAVWLAIFEIALEAEKYEICSLIEKAFQRQHRIMTRLIEETQVEEDLWHLEFTKEYFYMTKQLQANKQNNNN